MAGSGVVTLYGTVFGPVAFVPALHFAFTTPVVVSGKERLIFVAEAFKGFQFAAYVDVPLLVTADVERNDAYGVAGDQEVVGLFVIKGEGEDAVQFFEEVDTLVLVEGDNDLAVRACPEGVLPGITGTDLTMVIDFAIHGKDLPAVGRVEGLPTAFGVDDGEAFMCQDGTAAYVDTAPVRTAVTYLLRHFQRLASQFL